MPKTRKRAQRFEVEATLRNVTLAKTGSSVSLKVYQRGEKLGELQIGRGSIF